MSEGASGVHAAVVEVFYSGWVDVAGQWERIANEAVFEACDELGFPGKSLYLPGSEAEGYDGY